MCARKFDASIMQFRDAADRLCDALAQLLNTVDSIIPDDAISNPGVQA